VEVYKESMDNQFTENPLRNATLDQVALVGILNSKIGNVGVVEIAGQTFYVKVGDRIGVNEGVVGGYNGYCFENKADGKGYFWQYEGHCQGYYDNKFRG